MGLIVFGLRTFAQAAAPALVGTLGAIGIGIGGKIAVDHFSKEKESAPASKPASKKSE